MRPQASPTSSRGPRVRRRVVGALVVAPAAAVTAAAALLAASALAASSSGTGLTASVTTAGHLTSSYGWTIQKTATPASQMVPVGSRATVKYSITTTKSASGTTGGYLDGKVCVTNAGSVATKGLAVSDQLTEPPSMTVLNSVTVDVSAKPVLAAWASFCYPYKIQVPAASIVPGATYKTTAHVTITNYSGMLGTPEGPSPSATAPLPTTPVAVNASITVNDSNGQTFTYSSGGTQTYNQNFACATAAGAHTITHDNTATITQTGQRSSAQTTIHCGAPTTLTTTLSNTTIPSGGSATDQATITGAAPTAGGTITYKAYTNNTCSTPALYADATPTNNTVNAVAGAGAPASDPVTFHTAGTYYWQAVYSGDPNTNTLASTSSCNSEPLTVTSCTPGTIGCPWHDGDLTTYDQGNWGSGGLAQSILLNDYYAVYAPTGGGFRIGLLNNGFSALWTDPTILSSYMPATGPPAALDADLLNPTTSSSGVFGGKVAALKLNIDFSDAGDLASNSGLKFGDLTICNLTSDTDLNGITVRQFLGVVNTALGGGPTTDTIADLDAVTTQLDGSFFAGAVSAWAQQHLVNGACP